ncbi:Hypothetical protein A7982_00730 [Minicystis rosea]|nr:Hypothetical protein A7982_00730 [Minicystis rosea]
MLDERARLYAERVPLPPAGRFARILRSLDHPRAVPAVVLIALLVALSTLQIGFYGDDYSQLAQIERTHPALSHSSPVDLYRFIPGDRAELAGFVKYGPVPWFADPSLKLHFFRPLSSLLLTLDHALWGRRPLGYHITCVLLYVALVLVTALFYRTILGVRDGDADPTSRPRGAAVTATLAAIVFAIDAGHFQPIGWIASRHLLVAALPAVLGLMAHVRFVRDGFRAGRWLGPLGIVLALLGSEAGLGAVMYWLAFDAFGPAPPAASSLRARLRASLPVLVLTAVYALAYKRLGFGASGSGGYFDPATEPLAYLHALATRVPALLVDAFVHIPAEVSTIAPALPFVIAGLAVTFGMGALFRAVLPAVPDDERAALRWLLPAALGSLLLAAGGFPGSRLLLFPSIGLAVFVAVLLHRGTERLAAAPPLRAKIGLHIGRVLLVLVHLILAPLSFVANAPQFAGVARKGEETLRRADIELGAPRRVVVLAASDPMASFYPAAVAALVAPEILGSWNVLSMSRCNHRLTRTGAKSLRLDVIDGRMMEGAFEVVFRSPRAAFHPGDRVEISGATVTVMAVDRGAPTSIEATFDVDLEDPALYLIAWRDGRLARFSPPPVGGVADLRWSPGPLGFF